MGFRFGRETYSVACQEMIDFARKWDPRAIHLDEQAGIDAGFGGVIASGAYSTNQDGEVV